MAGGDAAPVGQRPGHIRTFHPRRGRMGLRQSGALARLWPRYGFVIAADRGPVDPVSAFGRRAPLVLEIGFGMGEATAEMAAADPARDYLAVEVHTPGIANLLTIIDERGLSNVRVALGDAVELLRFGLPPGSLDAVHVYFPDPWPKARHHKRRLIRPDTLELLRSRLAVGGRLHCATDWAPYAASMYDTLSADRELCNVYEGFAPRPRHRPVTRFEQRAVAAGRDVFDLIFQRGAPAR